MTTRLSAEDMARVQLTQRELDEYDAYMARNELDLSTLPEDGERNTMHAKYAIDAKHKQIDENTGLPAYPKSTFATETRLRNAREQLTATQVRVSVALDRALDEFEAALEREDRKRSTQERLNDMTRRTRRIN